MDDEVSTVFFYDCQQDDRLARVVSEAVENDWQVPADGGEYHYSISQREESASSVEAVVSELHTSRTASLTLEKDGFSIALIKDDPAVPDNSSIPPTLTIYCDRTELTKTNPSEIVESNIEDYIDLVLTVTKSTDPRYAFGRVGLPRDESQYPTLDEIKSGHVKTVYWLNVFSSRTIERLGRDEVLSAPAWRIHEVDDEHVLVLTRDNPVDTTEKWRYGPEEVMTYLSDAETETVWRRDETETPTEWYQVQQAKWLLPPVDESPD